MFDFRKFKRYKIRRLYVCKVELATKKQIRDKCRLSWSAMTPTTCILYRTIIPRYFIDPLTGQLYVQRKKIHFNTKDEFYIDETLGNIAHIFDIQNEIYSRGDYLKLQELMELKSKLKNKTE